MKKYLILLFLIGCNPVKETVHPIVGTWVDNDHDLHPVITFYKNGTYTETHNGVVAAKNTSWDVKEGPTLDSLVRHCECYYSNPAFSERIRTAYAFILYNNVLEFIFENNNHIFVREE